MSGRVDKLPSARQDLIDVFYYLTRNAGVATARGFLKDADGTFERLASMPGLGTRYEPDDPAFADVRFSILARFKTYLAFYRPVPGE